MPVFPLMFLVRDGEGPDSERKYAGLARPFGTDHTSDAVRENTERTARFIGFPAVSQGQPVAT